MTQKNTAHVFYRFFLLIYCLIDAAYALVFAGFIASVVAVDHNASGVALVAVIGGLILAAPTLWSLRMFLHYRRVVLTDVQTVELTRTSTTYLRRVGFTVTVSVGGETREVTTPSVFFAGRVRTQSAGRLFRENGRDRTRRKMGRMDRSLLGQLRRTASLR